MEGASILIVEDEAISALYLKNLLSRMHYLVTEIVASGENAIAKAQEIKPDLILMDIRLAGEMDGIQAADIIHSNNDIPVVFLTAHLDEDSMRRAMATEPAGYVSKPASERELRGTIEMALKNDQLRKQLRASETRYRSIFSTASVAITELDFSQVKQTLDDLRREGVTDIEKYIKSNPKFVRRILKETRVLESNDWSLQLIGAPDKKKFASFITKLVKSEFLPTFLEVVRAIWEGKPYYEGEGTIQTLSGERKYITINGAFLTGGRDLKRVLLISTDITQRKLVEAALRDSEEKYRRIVDTANEGIWIMGEDHSTTFVNPRFLEMSGYTREEMLGHRAEDFLFPEDHFNHLKRCEAREQGKSERYEHRFRCKDGSPLWLIVSATPMIDPTGKFIGSFSMLTDITERRRAEKELVESERRYRLLVESATEMITVVQNGCYVFANRKTEQLSGYSRAELLSKPVLEMIHPDDRENAIDINRRMIKGEPIDMPYLGRAITKSGEILWLQVNSALITWMGTPASLNIYTDITERKKIEEQLRLQAMVLDQIQDRVTVTDLDGRITYVNDAETQQLKYSRQEMVGQNVEMYGDDPTRGATQKEIVTKTISDGEWRGEVVNFDAQGNESILDCRTHMVRDDQGNPIALCGISTDITHRKQIEKTLAESEARYRQIVETTQEGIWILDKDLKLAFVNQRVIDMFGYSYEEFMGKTSDDIIFPEDLPDHKARLEARLQGEPDQYERRVRRKDGTFFWANVTATPILDNNGQFQGVVTMFTDITMRKQAEQILERQQSRIRTMDALTLELSKLNLDFQATLQTATRIIELSGDLCLIRLISDDGQSLLPIAVHHPNPEGRKLFENVMSTSPIRIEEGIFAQAVKTGQPLLVSEHGTPDLIALIKDEYILNLKKMDIVDGMVIPLCAQGMVIGDIILGRNSEQAPYNQEDLGFYKDVADRIAFAITNARMYSNAQKEIEKRREIESAVRLSEAKYRDLFELSPDANILIDTEGIILDCNLSTSKLTALSKEEMVGKAFFQVVNLTPEMRGKYMSLIKEGKSDQLLPFETEITRQDGQKLIIDIFPKLIKKEGVITGVQVIARDISNHKLFEQKLKDSLAEKDTLLSELNHRVKNNLASIISIMDLQKSYVNDDPTADLITELQERVRLLALIHEQLYRSKNINQIDFAKYLEDLTTNLARALLKGREILLDIHADAAQLGIAVAIPCGQIVTELMTNALKYAFPQENSDLWKEKQRKIEISFKISEDHYILTVSDNGIGLPPVLNFEYAETLGMQLIGLLTQQLNGTIEINDLPGASISVKFPRSAQ